MNALISFGGAARAGRSMAHGRFRSVVSVYRLALTASHAGHFHLRSLGAALQAILDSCDAGVRGPHPTC